VNNDDLRALSVRLLALHGALLDVERRAYEATYGPTNPGELLRLLLNDPRFAWLRPLSGIIARIDEALDPRAAAGDARAASAPPREPADAQSLFASAETLLRSSADPAFHTKYRDILQRSPEVVMAHADVVRILSARRSA
jgi:hypothetical protein